MKLKIGRTRNLLAIALMQMAVISILIIPARADTPSWDEVLKKARGETVDWFMYGGFPSANAYVNGYVAPRVKELYGITLRQRPVTDISEMVGKLVVEKQAGKNREGEADLLWINGENFRTAKKHGLLFGPFAHNLPNDELVDWKSPSIKTDFGEPVQAMESPWGSAQFVMVYDKTRTPEPPRTMAGLIEWIKEHPGRFAYPAPPDFTGSVFVRHVFYHVGGGSSPWRDDYSQEDFRSAADACFDLLKEIEPFLWRQGSTYPVSPVRLSQLFADGEVDFAMTYHPAEPSKLIHDGLYRDTVRTFVFKEGSIANTHFVAIPWNAGEKEAAVVVANFLLSPEAQLKKADPSVWGDLPAIDVEKLSDEWREKFESQKRGPATLPPDELASHRLPEPPSQILIELEKGWEEKVLRGR